MRNFVKRNLEARGGDLWLLSSKWLSPVFGLVGGLVTARFLLPEELGTFHAVMLIPAYASMLQLGVFSGLSRNLPLYRAKGEDARAQDFVNASARMATCLAGVGAVIAVISILTFFFFAENRLYPLAAMFLLGTLVFNPLQLHHSAVYRGMFCFDRLGKGLHLQNAWSLVCSLSTALIGVFGVGLKVAGNNLILWLALFRKSPLSARGGASSKDVLELSKIGLPVMFAGIIFTWLAVADRTIIATFLTAEDLGHFALAGIVLNAIKVFPESINTLLHPRIARAYGVRGSSRDLRRYLWIGLGLNLSLLIPIAVVGWLAVPHLVRVFLPAYTPGIEAAQIIAVGAIFQVYSGASAVIPVLRRNFWPNLFGCVAICLVWVFGVYAVKQGYGISGVAIARVGVTALYGIFVIAFVFYLTGRDVACHES
ncbi:MAG: lipopolysaccharide biosynthesis protein [Opitutaceae bacterium]